ncbi:flagellar biosynthesis protein FlgD [Burkholderia diffusa]|uniref:Basal-body rod modification protein FlgD n=1 Tax=Burkholderia diffusa TaxID=488732 RepID=A0AAW3P7U2_9BURK|nr:flagellar hook capping FlgD N-terminal domain-containing protein [Burkholderia diffusa]KVH43261.1 flagellar biosynthesis protein FlgD [Burkholderia diffusa]KVN02982.1 flagellar biosynthesis protein FlgD [Burkholderia diffusa]KWF41382.1 flagellar biosynthesis protein FlgD [Burkholderia diffusa]KWF44208.1 flagellar biosynthesis protein FlgD [Burkholderia diffusa]KWF45116.1 flagellar biosynthesis protein FlgD [Burkholderia diffusa]
MSNTIQPRSGDSSPVTGPNNNPPPNVNGQGSTTDIFAKLLTAQIQNQNPLEPSDPAQFVAQLMQMQQTEALNNVAALTANNAALMESMLVVSLGSQVGSQVMARTESLELDNDTVHGRFTLADAASDVSVVLTDEAGNAHRISLGEQAKGDVKFDIDPEKLGLGPGKYKIKVETDAGKPPAVEIAGVLENVRLGADGKVILRVAGIGEVDTGSISSFLGREPSNQTRKEST